MNAPVFGIAADDLEVTAAAVPDWPALTASVNLWRGRCLHLFARMEAAVSETLLLLANDAGADVALPLMVGPRYDELERILADRADAASKAALSALRGVRTHDKLRVFLCHGVATVLVDRKGDWHVSLDLLAFRNGSAARDELFLTGAKAVARYNALNAGSQRLGQKLAALTPA